jgi:2'-5' RNA ligase
MMLRSFVALEVPAGIQVALADSTASLRQALPRPLVRWVAPDNIHLTIIFLGDVPPARLEQLADALRDEANMHEPFELSVRGLGAFPHARKARIIWIGLEAPPGFAALVRGVQSTAAKLGFALEERPLSPHLTIGRVGQHATATDLQHVCAVLEATSIGIIGTIRVEALQVFKSELRPGGPVYTKLYSLPLGKPVDNNR